ncbi:MAG: HNH endonuclease, partial [Gordonia sp.]|nr:HNH endonuclease [Gordonia sp. (in: high G+C Gram-positive bacteria)]
MNIRATTEEMIDLVVPDDPGDLASLTKDLITLRNATESQLSVCAAMIDRLGFAKRAGTTPSKWLQDNGAAPAPASRWLRIGAGVAKLDRTAGYFRDGFLSTEHVDAVVKGIRQINDRSDVGISNEERAVFEAKLLSHAISGARPTEIEKIAQGLGNQVAHDTGGPTPAEDPSINELDYAFSEGRLVGRFDVDAQIGEKLHAALDLWSRPRPEPDGSDDARSDTQRRADALHQLLDCGGGGGDGFVSAPRTEVNVSVPADHPE